jgi:hypothetical protein
MAMMAFRMRVPRIPARDASKALWYICSSVTVRDAEKNPIIPAAMPTRTVATFQC